MWSRLDRMAGWAGGRCDEGEGMIEVEGKAWSCGRSSLGGKMGGGWESLG